MYTYIEEYIFNLYKSLSINKTDQLSIKKIADGLDLNVYYASIPFRFGRNIILMKSTKEKEWQMFGHEVGHYLRHCGCQLKMYYLFRELQENQANYFSYHFCVPTFMLHEQMTVYDIMNLFKVEYEFASRRMEMYKNKLYEKEYSYAWTHS
ncbi:ImmA/IrrE family metallo-endopeptidase [Virgibacillus alimentarius]|uniref:ImmA/IrrE family metallo-endopeptidase n=1 Tax=Virgibacillus alimentarius TaxID=698769 RepID=UPI00056EF5AB|nr:ImmA/IrrE family metallo-endopeptidase [Virgibacillus alimentarius]